MKKTALLLCLVMVSAIVGGSFAYGWYSVTNNASRENPNRDTNPADAATKTPDFSDPSAQGTDGAQTNPSTDSSALSQPLSIEQQLSRVTRENGQVRLTLDEAQLNQLVNGTLSSQPGIAQLLPDGSSMHTILEGDRIETGAVLNLSELPRESLPADVQTGLDQLTSVAPMLANRDIYMGIVARPQVQDGKINLKQDLSLKLGQFTLPMANVAEEMGLSTSEIEQRLNAILTQQGLTLENIEVIDQQLVITGAQS
ncbi:hypothetical protein [Leptothoe sp. PORK10 BA2]|uniref:hypothetical protein n=1 Tax=Leptothoe sp. PORK10 BA2 TaxID=3110254 RepID=UPI002B1FC782|nr:hypothetical protein [Leptothoe sp. PORK10 BA2]MEA5466409.1 hypothetical protein [Leptothoe sp. PORK10 BA2]